MPRAKKEAKKEEVAETAKEGALPTSVTVAFEEGGKRTYEGKDALANAKSFVSKKPNSRHIVE